jgi:hypothetical protein
MTRAVSYCPSCGDFLFNGRHQGNVERWCRELSETKTQGDCLRDASALLAPRLRETKTLLPQSETKTSSGECETKTPPSETKTPETKTRNRGGRPRRLTIPPWDAAGMSRATWYRRQQGP